MKCYGIGNIGCIIQGFPVRYGQRKCSSIGYGSSRLINNPIDRVLINTTRCFCTHLWSSNRKLIVIISRSTSKKSPRKIHNHLKRCISRCCKGKGKRMRFVGISISHCYSWVSISSPRKWSDRLTIHSNWFVPGFLVKNNLFRSFTKSFLNDLDIKTCGITCVDVMESYMRESKLVIICYCRWIKTICFEVTVSIISSWVEFASNLVEINAHVSVCECFSMTRDIHPVHLVTYTHKGLFYVIEAHSLVKNVCWWVDEFNPYSVLTGRRQRKSVVKFYHEFPEFSHFLNRKIISSTGKSKGSWNPLCE